ncbi:MAG TPA: hypothetical protein VK171_02115, partial [Fimbriimonas sp.]|nr:hypothetical protein [Fimbriimonas sp.]
ISELTAEEAEGVLSKGERVCVRSTSDPKKGILTKEGWIPRLLLAGAVVSTAAGCQTNTVPESEIGKPAVLSSHSQPPVSVGSTVPPSKSEAPNQFESMGKVKIESEDRSPILGESSVNSKPQQQSTK